MRLKHGSQPAAVAAASSAIGLQLLPPTPLLWPAQSQWRSAGAVAVAVAAAAVQVAAAAVVLVVAVAMLS